MQIFETIYPYFTKSAASPLGRPIELHSIEEQKSRLVVSSAINMRKHANIVLRDAVRWLPFAAEKYGISPNLKDYILAPVVSLPSDLPNVNGECFPLKELSAWVVSAKMPMYKTWSGVPLYDSHDNTDYTKAKGIVFSSVMVKIPNTHGDLWKVVQLAGVDRNREPLIANEILTRQRTHYSIGAYTEDYACSICGHSYSKGEVSGWCDHISNSDRYKIINGKLAYWNVKSPIGFELSTISPGGTGAFVSTWDTPILDMSQDS
jgi:hypothetical protein